MPSVIFEIGQEPAQVGGPNGIPPHIRGAICLNSSEGLGDKPNAANIIVDNTPNCALTPQQVGCRLRPGELIEMPLINRSNGTTLPLFAVADGPGATLTVLIDV